MDGSLGSLCKNRDNNLQFLRFMAAIAVVYAHSFGVTGHTKDEIFFSIFGIGIGDVAVDVFFVISGFLVTKSFCSRSFGDFLIARVTRIYPALWVSTFLFVLIAGLIFSPLPAVKFWLRHDTLTYVFKNLTMLPGIGHDKFLPFAFDSSHSEFNTSLWTLPHELQMYMLLSGLGVLGLLRFPSVVLGVVLVGGTSFVSNVFGSFHLLDIDRSRFIFLFFSGAAFYVLRHKVFIPQWLAGCLILALGMIGLLTRDHLWHRVALVFVVPFLSIWIGFFPGGAIRKFNSVGDYSYGLYIFSCPIQFYLAARYTDAAPWEIFLLTLVIVIPMAILSWRFVESRALRVNWKVTAARYRMFRPTRLTNST